MPCVSVSSSTRSRSVSACNRANRAAFNRRMAGVAIAACVLGAIAWGAADTARVIPWIKVELHLTPHGTAERAPEWELLDQFVPPDATIATDTSAGRWLLTAPQATAGGNLIFLRDNILYHEDELLAEAHTPDVFRIFDRIAARVPPGGNGVLCAVDLGGARAGRGPHLARQPLQPLAREHA